MRRGLLALVLASFAAFVVWKVVPFLRDKQQETFATPTVQATDPASLAPVSVKGHQRVCLERIEYGPKAKYVLVTLESKRASGPILLEARAPGYSAMARQSPGLRGTVPILLPIEPAPHEVDGGTLCLTNRGRHKVAFYGINPGRGSSPATTTVDGKAIQQQLSVTLLTSPSKSLGGRLGDIFDRVAAFRPVTGWEVWLLALLALIGLPVALGVALARSAALDDAEASPHSESPRR
jgi:hypothetical protein